MRWEEQGEGTPVVFVHGIPTSPRLWRHVVPRVEGARRLAWDMVGYGASIAEGRHRLARSLFHGKRGELRQRYREGQEDQLGALGLVVNTVVLWNTRYMQAALGQLRAQGEPVRREDMARLWPVGHKHINVLGRYHFDLDEQGAQFALRPLRTISEAEDWLR